MMNKFNKKTRDPARLSLPLIPRNRSGQDEMVGFAVIVILIGVIVLVAIGFLVNTKNETVVQDYEIESFIQASLQYTTDCQYGIGYLSVKEVIISCQNNEICQNENNSCIVLNSTLKNLIEKGWNVGSQSAIKGYELNVKTGNENTLNFKKGNQTADYKAGIQSFTRNGIDYSISLNLYS
jgi:hypothetical protein